MNRGSIDETTLHAAGSAALEQDWDCDPHLWLYRERTVGLLKKYLRFSIEVGRLPSLLGREFFRTRITTYSGSTFEDAVIFVHDIDRILQNLQPLEKELIVCMVFQEYSQDEAARLLRCWRRTLIRRFQETLDKVTQMLLAGGILESLPNVEADEPEEGIDVDQLVENGDVTKSCQGSKTVEKSATNSIND